MKRRNFICSISCFLAGYILSDLNNKYKKIIPPRNQKNAYKYIESNGNLKEIFVEAASHCNLNCKSCDAFSPLSKQEFIEYEQFEKDFRKIKALFPNKDISIIFIGGEPLLNPDITKMINLTAELFPNSKKKILTNGILLKDMDEEFYLAAKNADMEIQVTNHPIDIDRSIGENRAKKYGINYRNDVIYSDKLYDLKTRKVSKENLNTKNCHCWGKQDIEFSKENINIETCHCWGKPVIDITGSQDYIEKRYNCIHKEFGRDFGVSYARGNFYYCWIHAHIGAFSKYFKLNIPIEKEDYIKISDVKEAKEINDFISSPKPLCRFCKQCHNICFHGKPIEWGFSKRELSEWT